MRAALIALMLMIGSQAGADNVLYCSTAPNLATGFVNRGGKWHTAKFFEERFSVKEVGNFSSVIISDSVFSCRRPYKTQLGAITCQEKLGYVFNYDERTKKFIFFQCSTFSYTHPTVTATCITYVGSCEDF
jgi:hypothetical protein